MTIPDDWNDATAAVPRKGQTVRILTQYGVDHEAQFVVAFTKDWPSGAWWSIQNGRVALPFADIVAWSPDLEARATRTPATRPSVTKQRPAGSHPALVGELLSEVDRVGGLIRLIPPTTADWSPHADVASPRTLAWRLAQIVARLELIFSLDHVELSLEAAALQATPEDGPLDVLEATYSANSRAVATVAVKATANSLRAPWRLEHEGEAIVTMPRGNAVRTFGMGPLVYHRGELGLLLKALGVEVPHPYPLWSFEGSAPRPA